MDGIDFQKVSQTVLDHAQKPRNVGPLSNANGHACITGPCGDTMEFWFMVQNEKVEKASFVTDGCAYSLACGSMATCLAEGGEVEDVARISPEDILEAMGGVPEEGEHCALLAANTLRAACEDYRKHKKQEPRTGSSSTTATCESCGDKTCSASTRKEGESEEAFEDRRKLQSRLCRVRHKIVVLSGKGGVGKSMVAVNLAVSLVRSGKRVGLLDVDIHGPSIPTMLGIEHERIYGFGEELIPVDVEGLKVMSTGFLLRSPDDAVIWRGPLKMGVIKQFLKDVAWGDLDYLIIDSPPGTGDEPLSVCQLIDGMDGALIVTTPQKVATVDVRKSITFCQQLKVPVLGVVENMSGFVCPHCGETTQILRSGGGECIARDMNVPFLGSIPMDPKIAESCDNGEAFVQYDAASPTAALMRKIIQPIIALDEGHTPEEVMDNSEKEKETQMRIAIPLTDGKLSMHFGHCEHFALIDVDPSGKKILKHEDTESPPHQPGLLPLWLAERGVNMIIAGGMGQRAQGLFAEQGIKVMVGAPAETPEKLVSDYLTGTLQVGDNICDH